VNLSVQPLDDSNIEAAARVMALEQTTLSTRVPELPGAYTTVEGCAAALNRLRHNGHTALVLTGTGNTLGLLAGRIEHHPSLGRHLHIPADGLAIDPETPDATAALAQIYGQLAEPFVAEGIVQHYAEHLALPHVTEAFANLGFRRGNVFAVRSTSVVEPNLLPACDLRFADAEDLATIARLDQFMNEHRAAAPLFGPGRVPPFDELLEQHRRLQASGAIHLIASVVRQDVGMLTLETDSPAPRLCPSGDPFIGPRRPIPRPEGSGSARRSSRPRWIGPARKVIARCRSTSNPRTGRPARSGWVVASVQPAIPWCER
jgi:hypothetical protein